MRIDVDWSDTGLYDHADSDITAYYRDYTVTFGADLSRDRSRISLASARGRVSLEDHDGRFNPDVATGLGSVLKERHLTRFVSTYDTGIYAGHSFTLWEGYGEIRDTRADRGAKKASLELTGKLQSRLSDKLTIPADLPDGAVSDWLEGPRLDIGQSTFLSATDPLVYDMEWPLRDSGYRGTVSGLIGALADFAGGWAFEDRLGYLVIHSLEEIRDAHVCEHIQETEHTILAKNVETGLAPDLMRNSLFEIGRDGEKRILLDLHNRIATYGRREQEVPAFYAPGVSDALLDSYDYIGALSLPRQVVSFTLLRDQGTQDRRRQVEWCYPGQVFQLTAGGASGYFYSLQWTMSKRYRGDETIRITAIDRAWPTVDDGMFILGESRLGTGELGDGTP